MTARIATEPVDGLVLDGVHAFTTTRAAGTFGTSGDDPVHEVMGRWSALAEELQRFGPRLASASQVHGTRVVTHGGDWAGWLRIPAADGHVAARAGTALAIVIADCVPVFLAHASGAVALLHAGWRGTAAHILEAGVRALRCLGIPPKELHLSLGPAICGRCYEVSPDVYERITARAVSRPTTVDLRDVLARQARALGIARIHASSQCTRCDHDRFFSHRAGDRGRQVAVIVAASDATSLDSP
ncbi:MAG TPA: polyphenol oxidase family protein [Gemmatimonadaceae bacterium]|nr:polyphenol oxidase family protein [Gemmatimonadaceae bacterium]